MNSNLDQHSHLFLVRFWSEEVGNQKELRGRVQHVVSGEAHTFHDWPTLRDLMLEMTETEVLETRAPEDGPDDARGGVL